MDRQICFRSDYFWVVVIIMILVIVWVLYTLFGNYQKLVTSATDMYKSLVTEQSPQTERPVEGPTRPPIDPQVDVYNFQKQRDMQRMYDPLIPPVQRGFYPPTNIYQLPFNIPTQGPYDSFQQVGYVHRQHHPDQMYQLMGRKLDSYRYEYYIIHPQSGIKIAVDNKNDHELQSGDQIHVHGYKHPFKVQIYDNDFPRYISY